MKISVSSLSTIRNCPMKYKWSYIDGYKPFKKSNALTLGSVLHSAFAMHYNNFSNEEVVKYIKDTMDQEIAKSSPEEAEDLVTAKYTTLGMFIYYPKDLSYFKNIIPEKEFIVELFPGTQFSGFVDGLVVDEKNRLWVRELKTTSMSFQQFEKRSKTTVQGTGYIWAMQKLGFPVVGIMYDFIKKPLLRKGVKDDVHSFGYRIMDDYKTRPENYFKRHFSYRNKEELDLFEEDLIKSAKEMNYRRETNDWCRNQDQCWNYNSECPYLKICFQKQPDPLTIQLFYVKEVKNNV